MVKKRDARVKAEEQEAKLEAEIKTEAETEIKTEEAELEAEEQEAAAGSDFLGESDEDLSFKVSEKFARKYNEVKDKQELSRAKKILADEDVDSSYSDSETEDEGGDLLTSKVESKIFDTLHRIRTKDPSIYDKSKNFFEDEDFAPDGASKKELEPKGEKRMQYKDFLRDTLMREGADALVEEEEAFEAGTRQKTPKEEQRELRESIISAVRSADDEADDDDDDLFTLKEKSASEKKEEEASFQAFSAQQRPKDSEDIISRFWKDDSELDENERFLRDYVLKKGWQETTALQPKDKDSDSDGEDSHLDDVDDFEQEYNFRFEMQGGQQIQGHKRFQESSVRERNDKRKRQRQHKAEREETEKIRRTEELKRLKNLKKQEIKRRLQQLQEVTGNEELPMGAVDLDTDFDPEKHDQEMTQIFDDGFENAEEPLDGEELVRASAGCDVLDVSNDATEVLKRHAGELSKRKGSASKKKAVEQTVAAKDEETMGKQEDEGEGGWDDAGGAEAWEEQEEEDAADENNAAQQDEDVDPEEWWLCDQCNKGILPGKKRFDCTVCENYTLCHKCFRCRWHKHRFVRRNVHEKNVPPPVEELASILEGGGSTGSAAAPSASAGDALEETAEQMLDEYFQLDYEDIIGGDLPTRFKYQKVAANDCGLTPKQILEKSDKELNRVVPLKKLRTYRTDNNKVRNEAVRKWKGQMKIDDSRSKGASEPASSATVEKAANLGVTTQRYESYNFTSGKGKTKIRKKKTPVS